MIHGASTMPEYEESYVTISRQEYCCPFCGGTRWHDIHDETGDVLRGWCGVPWIERIHRESHNGRYGRGTIAECATCGATASSFYSRAT